MNRLRDLALAAFGLAILVFAVSRIGTHNLLRQIDVLKIGLPIIVALSFARLILQTVSWNIALRREGIEASFTELMLVRLASQAMGYLTVLGPAASEPMRISLLRSHARPATTATLVDTGVYWIASGLVGIAGCLAAAIVLADHHHSTAPVLALGLFLSAAVLFILRAESPISSLAGALRGRCPKWLAKAAQIDARLRNFARSHPGEIRKMFALDLVCQALIAGEVVAAFWSLRLPIHFMTILGLEAATRMVKLAAGFMPARIGADEGGAAAAAAAFGLPAASGLALALARRIKDLIACFVGLVWLASQRSSEATGDITTVSV